MLIHPQFDPIALQIGPLAIHWYGLMYLVSFALVWWVGRQRIRSGRSDFTLRDLEDIIFFGVAGVIIGGRLGYTLLYQPAYYLAHPVEILYVWQGGMAFHGGLVGVIVALWLFARRRGRPFLAVTDFIAPLVPLGLAAGRLGNFINGELWGRPTSLPWGMQFPQAGDALARHPSQLYELGLEGLVLFALLWWWGRQPRPMGQISGLFLVGYGVLRFLVEFTREPDAFLGTLAAGLSMGQWLSIPMAAAGVAMCVIAGRRHAPLR